MASSGRRPVLALLSAGQVPLLGPTSALIGLASGMKEALHLAVFHTAADVADFDATLSRVRRDDRFDLDFSRAFAAGYTLAASEVRRIGGMK